MWNRSLIASQRLAFNYDIGGAYAERDVKSVMGLMQKYQVAEPMQSETNKSSLH